MAKPGVMIGLGEVLWDILPSGKVLGGAPANFAYMTHVLGDEGIVASRVGNDESGHDALRVMQGLGLNHSCVQLDDHHGTGMATVSIDGDGQPTFTIRESVAWDFLQWTPDWEKLSSRADVICFGSLAQRSPVSASTIESFLQNAPDRALRICDVNLRQSFYTKDVLQKSFQHAHIVKVNDQELLRVSSLLNLGAGSEEVLAMRLVRECDLKLVCITRGGRGSLLVSHDERAEHSGFPVEVTDAIGAGDAFTACLAHYYFRGSSLEEISEAANRFAAWVATQRGATPLVSKTQLQNILAGTAIR